MNLVIIHKRFSQEENARFLRLIAPCAPMAKMALDRLTHMTPPDSDKSSSVVLPQSWAHMFEQTDARLRYYDEQAMSLPMSGQTKYRESDWSLISNGQFVASPDQQWLWQNVKNLDADIIAVQVDPELNASRERVRFTSGGTIAGFCRLYASSAHVVERPANWPHHLLVKSNLLHHFAEQDQFALDFQTILNVSSALNLNWRTLHLGGTLLDLSREKDLLNFFRENLQNLPESHSSPDRYPKTIHETARVFGKVQIGNNVTIGENALVVGPTIIGHNVTIDAGAVVRYSILATASHVNQNRRVENTICFGDNDPQSENVSEAGDFYQNYLSGTNMNRTDYEVNNFRTWRGFGYANHLKRLADILSSAFILLIFSPVLPVIALIIKLTSKGPIFFGHNRQGLHGKEFKCWKFRTMLVGADDLQAALRARNEVDGPQFKMEDDPRINGVGYFLRETCLDEIPQFYNVLCGQMSLVGPRPSPEKENSLCPPWRDARLSVRPGITGLWQVSRTRQQAQDFQEWVYYDTYYVKNLSWKKDFWICCATVKELTTRFINQF